MLFIPASHFAKAASQDLGPTSPGNPSRVSMNSRLQVTLVVPLRRKLPDPPSFRAAATESELS